MKLLFNHRESKDIDIFFRDRQLLSCVSPRLVDANENELIGDSETSSYIKLNFPEGQVDFIVAGQISDEEPQLQKIPGFDEEYYLDSPVEIVAKKIFYRYEDFTARDVFDLAFVFYKTSEKLVANAEKFRGKIKPLIKRIEKLKTQGYLAAELNSLARLSGADEIKGEEYHYCYLCLQCMAGMTINNSSKQGALSSDYL